MKECFQSILKSLILPVVVSICLFTPYGSIYVSNTKLVLCFAFFLLHLFVKRTNRCPILSFVCFVIANCLVYFLALLLKEEWMNSNFISNKMGLLVVVTIAVCFDLFLTIYKVARSHKEELNSAKGEGAVS